MAALGETSAGILESVDVHQVKERLVRGGPRESSLLRWLHPDLEHGWAWLGARRSMRRGAPSETSTWSCEPRRRRGDGHLPP